MSDLKDFEDFYNDHFNEVFERGRLAGRRELYSEILRYDASFAYDIAKEFKAEDQRRGREGGAAPPTIGDR